MTGHFWALVARCVLACALTSGAAEARCVGPGDLAKGISFARQDGRVGRLQVRDGGIEVDYAAGPGVYTDLRQTNLGIYETGVTEFFEDEPSVGGGDTVITRRFRGAPPVPAPVTAWRSRLREDAVHYNSSEAGHYDTRQVLEVVYEFLPAEEVKISGCPYWVIPVEATFLGDDVGRSQRWLYFRDLGFGIETRVGQARMGITRLKPE